MATKTTPFITVNNPHDVDGTTTPLAEGTVAEVGGLLAPGSYPATSDDTPGTLVVQDFAAYFEPA